MNELQVTRCQHKETGQFADIPTEALPGWEKLGWDPLGPSQSLAEIHDAKVTAENAQAATEAAADVLADEVPDHTVKEIVDEVGDDPVKAQAALEAEQATDAPRKTLVAALTKVLEATPDPDAGAAGDGATEAGQPGNPEGN